MANVVFSARSLVKMVTNIQSLLSVNAVGETLLNYNLLRRSKFLTTSAF